MKTSGQIAPPPAASGPVLAVSVVIVARNEAANLACCLASVQGWVDECVVLLNDTTDASEAVARSFGAAVHRVPWQGYRDTKNHALSYAGREWILSLDADEEVSAPLRDGIRSFFARGDDRRFTGAQFPRQVWFINRWMRHGDWYPDLSLRLFHRRHARWGGNAFIHEKIECPGPVATLRGDLLHRPYPTLGAHHLKILEYARLFAEDHVTRERAWSPWAAAGRPAWRFFRAYVLRRGFLDGFPGFVAAVGIGYYTFLRYACVYERTCRPRP